MLSTRVPVATLDELRPLLTAVLIVGLLANTLAPVPVSSVRADARLALEGVARNVATPVPNPERSPAFVVVVVVAGNLLAALKKDRFHKH